MNFLSHFYFERHNTNDFIVMGVVLPDFVKNAHKDWNLNPQKAEYLYEPDPDQFALLTGWKRHLEVDRQFHSSGFFKEETAKLKKFILPAMNSGPVKPFFLAHIGLELILDHLLITKNVVSADTFYRQLYSAKGPVLDRFLAQAGLPDEVLFDKFLTNFISSRYLLSYLKMENITYALNRICMRLWAQPFTEEQLADLTGRLILYKESIQDDFMVIFDQIESELMKQEL